VILRASSLGPWYTLSGPSPPFDPLFCQVNNVFLSRGCIHLSIHPRYSHGLGAFPVPLHTQPQSVPFFPFRINPPLEELVRKGGPLQFPLHVSTFVSERPESFHRVFDLLAESTLDGDFFDLAWSFCHGGGSGFSGFWARPPNSLLLSQEPSPPKPTTHPKRFFFIFPHKPKNALRLSSRYDPL